MRRGRDIAYDDIERARARTDLRKEEGVSEEGKEARPNSDSHIGCCPTMGARVVLLRKTW